MCLLLLKNNQPKIIFMPKRLILVWQILLFNYFTLFSISQILFYDSTFSFVSFVHVISSSLTDNSLALTLFTVNLVFNAIDFFYKKKFYIQKSFYSSCKSVPVSRFLLLLGKKKKTQIFKEIKSLLGCFIIINLGVWISLIIAVTSNFWLYGSRTISLGIYLSELWMHSYRVVSHLSL